MSPSTSIYTLMFERWWQGGNDGGLALWPGSLKVWPAGEFGQAALDKLAEQHQLTLLAAAPRRAGELMCYDGRLWHHGAAHSAPGVAPRRVFYFTSLHAEVRF